jgi:hypothetical protein
VFVERTRYYGVRREREQWRIAPAQRVRGVRGGSIEADVFDEAPRRPQAQATVL